MAWFKPKTKFAHAPAQVPAGEVVYAVGDVHGRADLLTGLLAQIDADAAARPDLQPRLIMLGDYVDRGPESRRVLDVLVDLQVRGQGRMTALRGNHEATMLDFLRSPKAGIAWCEYGGRDTLLSYGVVAPHGRDRDAWTVARDALTAALPAAHLQFLNGLDLMAEAGDYLFVHAGLKPDMPVERQSEEDMLWIREEFLESKRWLPQMVVHGHTPAADPLEGPGRIGIDTGAYATGVLTALRLEGGQRSYIRTNP